MVSLRGAQTMRAFVPWVFFWVALPPSKRPREIGWDERQKKKIGRDCGEKTIEKKNIEAIPSFFFFVLLLNLIFGRFRANQKAIFFFFFLFSWWEEQSGFSAEPAHSWSRGSQSNLQNSSWLGTYDLIHGFNTRIYIHNPRHQWPTQPKTRHKRSGNAQSRVCVAGTYCTCSKRTMICAQPKLLSLNAEMSPCCR